MQFFKKISPKKISINTQFTISRPSILKVGQNQTMDLSITQKSKYLSQVDAAALDQDLFNEYKYSVDQLMELAGLSCAAAIRKVYYPEKYSRVLVVCGPGNNGGDGLVAARHLTMMGYTPHIYYPKRTAQSLYQNLTHQCVKHGIQFLEDCPSASNIDENYDVVVDGLFGFSFKPPIREGMLPIMTALSNMKVACCSIDIPSGWDVDSGPSSDGPAIKPSLLISLSAPKYCSKLFYGIHYLGGRFLPQSIIEKYNLELPNYPEADQVVLIQNSS